MPDHCGACGRENRSGARFCSGCGAALPVNCPSCGSELAEDARFCDACGAAVIAPAAAKGTATGRRTVSVIFSDLAGSTAMQEALDAESVPRVMSRYYEVMRGVVEQHEGTVEKFIGDAVVAVFGRPAVREDDALRAVRCAGEMSARLDDLNDELERQWGVRLALRTGVNTGELVVSPEGIIVGDTMNTAARLEQAAPAGEVLIGEPTWRLVRHQVIGEEVEPLDLKGKSAPVRAWRLVAADPGDGSHPGGAPAEAPLVARDTELTRLGDALDQAIAERSCRLVTVIGSPGLGKSRLVTEFTARVSGRALVVHGHCEVSGEGITFLPVAEVVREVAGIAEADEPATVLEKLRALAPEGDPDRGRLVEGVAAVVGVGEPVSVQEIFWALRRGLEAIAREHPLVVVLDDLHWGQPMLLDLLEHLVEWIADAPVLILALARPELRESREVLTSIGRRASDVIELEPLEPDQSRALVGGLLGAADLPAELVGRILETTEGNPLFLSELVRMLVDEGSLVRTGDGWVVAGGVEAVAVPPTIHALLTARIERLRAGERAVVERAAVIGKQFYRGAVAELLAPPIRTGIDGHLEALRRKEMVEPEGVYWIDEPVYRFHHVLIRDAAYRLLLKEARSVLHERFADWLEEKAGEMAGEHEEVIAFHLEQAHAYRRDLGPLDDAGRALGARAAGRLHSAGRRALAREDLAAAGNLLSRALACDAGDATEILWDLAESVLSAGDVGAAAQVVERYAAAVTGAERDETRAAVMGLQLANLLGERDPGASVDSVLAAAAALRELGDGAGEAKAWAVAAQIYARLGRVAEVEVALDRALTAARAADDRRRTTAVLAAAPRAALWGPSSVVRASGRCLDVVRILRMASGNRHVEALALRCQAVLEAMRGRIEAAREILAGARTTLEELGLSLELNETRVHAGLVELLADDPAAAVEHLRSALAGFESLGADAAAANAAALLARALVARRAEGDVEAALTQAEFAREHGGEDLRTALIAACAGAEALAATGHLDEAVAMARHAVALAEPTDALPDKADASMSLARVLRAAGDHEGAREAARSARTCYEAKGHTVGAQRATKLTGDAPATVAPRAEPQDAGVLGNRPSERVLADFVDCCNLRDFDRLVTMLADDCYIFDHRALAWEEVRGREHCLVAIRSPLEASPHVQIDIDEVLARDDRVVVTREAWRGRGLTAGALEVRVGAINIIENGLWVGVEFYEPDDAEAMLARFAELARESPMPEMRPSERVNAEEVRRYSAHDAEGYAALYDESCVVTDHRPNGWGTTEGREAIRVGTEMAYAISDDVRMERDELIAGDDRVLALRVAYRGHAKEGGGEFELIVGYVSVYENGQVISSDVYEADDRQAMVARYAELGGGMSALGDSEAEQRFAEFAQRFARAEIGPLLELISEDYEVIDHRFVGWEPIRGHDGFAALVTSAWAAGDIRIELDEVLAASDRAIAVRMKWIGHSKDSVGGEFVIEAGQIGVADDEGRIVLVEQFDPADTDAILARFAELTGGPSGSPTGLAELANAEVWRRYNAHDPDGYAAMYAEDFILIDHRRNGWGTVRGPGGMRGHAVAAFAGSSDIRAENVETIACDDRVVAGVRAWRGHGNDGGGQFELVMGYVNVYVNGLAVSCDLYEPTDRQAMIARFAELTSEAP